MKLGIHTLTNLFINLALLGLLVSIAIAVYCAHLVLKPTSPQPIPAYSSKSSRIR